MKKILSVMTAAMLAATLTGCAAKPLSKKEYQKQAAELFGDYLSAFENAGEIFKGFSGEYGSDDFFDELKDNKEDIEEELKKANECLDQIQKLNPPEEMQDFHEDFLSALEKSQSMKEKMLDFCDAKSEEKLNSAYEKLTTACEKADKAFDKLGEDDDNDWFAEEVVNEFGTLTFTDYVPHRMSRAEYQKKVTELVINYLCALKDASEVFQNLSGISDPDDLFDELKDIKADVDKELKKMEEYMGQVQKLNPPEEMQDFHEDLLSAMEKAQNMGEKLAAVCDAKDEDEIESALYNMATASEEAGKAFKKLEEDDDNDWFVDEIEDEFGDDFFG